MPTPSDPLSILLAHDRWANRQLLNACAQVSHAQLHERFGIGCGSLHDTLVHLASAMRTWGDVLARRALRERPDQCGRDFPLEEVDRLLEEAAAELVQMAGAHPLDEIVTREHGGKTYQFPRGGVLTHVTTHGVHHRAQAINMLRRLGVSPLPASSVADWMRSVTGQD